MISRSLAYATLGTDNLGRHQFRLGGILLSYTWLGLQLFVTEDLSIGGTAGLQLIPPGMALNRNSRHGQRFSQRRFDRSMFPACCFPDGLNKLG